MKTSNKNIFVAGYSTLSKKEKKKADIMIKNLRKEGNRVSVGI